MLDGERVSTEPIRSKTLPLWIVQKSAWICGIEMHADQITHCVDVFIACQPVVRNTSASSHTRRFNPL